MNELISSLVSFILNSKNKKQTTSLEERFFSNIVGYADLKKVLMKSVLCKEPVHILLTKSDKLSRQQAQKTLSHVRALLQDAYAQCSVQLFSSMTKEGVEEATALLGTWFGLDTNLIQELNSAQNKNKPKIKNPRLKGNKTGGKLP